MDTSNSKISITREQTHIILISDNLLELFFKSIQKGEILILSDFWRFKILWITSQPLKNFVNILQILVSKFVKTGFVHQNRK